MTRSIVVLLIALLCAACNSTVQRVSHHAPVKLKSRWAMLPFSNHSETPQAGERAEALLGTILRARGVNQLEPYPAPKEEEKLMAGDRLQLEEAIGWAKKQKVDYAVLGSVEEWRYKGGVDAEPAVGVSVQVMEVSTSRILWVASGSHTGSGSESTSGVALKLLDAMVKELDVVP